VIATATVFFKRFYAINSLHTIDPLLLAPTAVFLVTIERRGIQYNNIEQNGTYTITK
jgi:cyclin-C